MWMQGYDLVAPYQTNMKYEMKFSHGAKILGDPQGIISFV